MGKEKRKWKGKRKKGQRGKERKGKENSRFKETKRTLKGGNSRVWQLPEGKRDNRGEKQRREEAWHPSSLTLPLSSPLCVIRAVNQKLQLHAERHIYSCTKHTNHQVPIWLLQYFDFLYYFSTTSQREMFYFLFLFIHLTATVDSYFVDSHFTLFLFVLYSFLVSSFALLHCFLSFFPLI